MSSSPRKILGSQENVSAAAEDDNARQRPPKPPRSAFMCFTDAKKKEIMRLNDTKENSDVLALVAEAWRNLSDRDRAHWDEEARNDKVRFVREKSEYKGVWVVPKRRAKKHPLAPKRPMSAFLKYSQTRRGKIKAENPDMGNTDISRLLGEMWRNARPSEKNPYVEDEKRERAVYKEVMQKWRDKQAKMDAASRTSHHSVQKMTEYPSPPPPPPPPTQHLSYGGYGEPVNFEPLHLHTLEDAIGQVDQRVFQTFDAPPIVDAPGKADLHMYRTFSIEEPNQKVDQRMFRPFGGHPGEGASSKSDPPMIRAYNGPFHQHPFRPVYHSEYENTKQRTDTQRQRAPSQMEEAPRYDGRSKYFSEPFGYYPYP